MAFFTYFVITVLIAFWYHTKYNRRNGLLHKIPALRSYYLIGSNLSFLGKSAAQILKTLEKGFTDLGSVYRFDFSPFSTTVMIANPVAAEALLSSPRLIEKSYEYGFLKKWLADGLLLSGGKKWHQRRKIITPTFHFKILEHFADIMDSQGQIFVSNMKKHEGQHVDYFPLISLYALDVICESAMGCKLNAQNDSSSSYVKAVKEISNIIFLRTFDGLKRFDVVYRLTSMFRQEKKALKILHDFTLSVIASRKKELLSRDAKPAKSVNDDGFGIKKKTAFLDMLLESTIEGDALSDEDIREEVDTFMFEGHDTTTSGIAFVLYNLAKYPDIQQRVFEESRAAFGDDLRTPVSMQQLNELSYLELVIKESLRLYPSVPFFGRNITEEVVLGKTIIPANTSVLVSPFLLGRNPEVFPDPLKFDPSRFDVETNNEKNNPFAYIPFSAGPRNCIGQKFAMLEMKSIVSKIVRNYKLSMTKENQELQLISELILRPGNGIKLCANQRVF